MGKSDYVVCTKECGVVYHICCVTDMLSYISSNLNNSAPFRCDSCFMHLSSLEPTRVKKTSLGESLAATLGETFGEIFRARQVSSQSLGLDYLHGSPQDSLRDSFFYAGKTPKSDLCLSGLVSVWTLPICRDPMSSCREGSCP